MKKKILVFGASNSKNSINHKFAKYAASKLENVVINLIYLSNFEMPIFSIDREKEEGIPQFAYDFLELITDADEIIISFAEHNGNYTVAYKNISDWISRINLKTWQNKSTLLLSTSPGGSGAKSVLSIALKEFKLRGANVIGSFSLPNFNNTFSDDKGIIDEELNSVFERELEKIKK